VRIAVVGGGPGGLFLATLIRTSDPSMQVTVYERNRADDTFGFGVVFSDRTLAGIHDADPVLREALAEHGRHWDDIEVRLKGERIRCGGNGMAAIVRKTLLGLLQDRAREAGAELRFGTEVGLDDLGDADLVVAADGAGSRLREQVPGLGTEVQTAAARFIWFGTDYLFDGLTFVHERGPDGVFAVHGYPISAEASTFIVETDEASWRRAGLDEFDVTQPPGASDLHSKEYLEKLFADQIDGGSLLVNNSRWGSFRTRRTRHWHTLVPRPMAFLGDAVHTAHFSVGSGTKMAMEDAIALADALTTHPGDLPAALSAYEAAAQPSVRRIQDSARPSLAWWEHFGRYHDHFEPWQFAYHFLSRSITDGRLARRAPDFVDAAHAAWVARHGAEPLDTPLQVGDVRFPGRIVALDDPSLGAESGALTGLDHYAVAAPDDEAGLPEAYGAVAGAANSGVGLVAVHGGTPLTRTLLCEQARMECRVAALLVDPDLDRDRALTAVLAGRADLVAIPGAST
jgi:anthraniloyl-CoA monooxygenase